VFVRIDTDDVWILCRDKVNSSFACKFGLYSDRARTQLIGNGVFNSDNLAFDNNGAVTGDIVVQSDYDPRLILLVANANMTDANLFANYAERRVINFRGLDASQVRVRTLSRTLLALFVHSRLISVQIMYGLHDRCLWRAPACTMVP